MDDFQIRQEQKLRSAADKAKREQMKHRAGVGDVVSRVTAHPDWKVYCDHLQAILAAYEKKIEGFKATLVSPRYKKPEELEQLNFDYAVASAHAAGLTQAINTAHLIVDQGKRSKEELSKLE